MNRIIQFVVIAILSFSFVGCEFFDGSCPDSGLVKSAQTVDEETRKENNDTTQQNQVIQDAVAQKSKEIDNKLASQEQNITKLSKSVDEFKSSTNDKIDKKSAYTFMILEFLILGLGLGILFRWLRKNDDRLKRHRKEISEIQSSLPSAATTQNVSSSLISNNREISDLKRQQKTLESRVATLEKKLRNQANLTTQIQDQNQMSNQHNSSNQETKPATDGKVFYMPRTTKGSFDDSLKSLVPDEYTYFKFKIISAYKAEFEFYAGSDQTKVKRSYDERTNSILSVCDILPGTSSPKECRTVKPGIAELVGGVWKVKTKAQILYV